MADTSQPQVSGATPRLTRVTNDCRKTIGWLKLLHNTIDHR